MSALIGSIVAFIVAGLAILGLVPHQQMQPVPQLPQQAIEQPTNATQGQPRLEVLSAQDYPPKIVVAYTNMSSAARSLFLCVPSGACTEWGVEFAPKDPNGTFTMTDVPGSTKHIGAGTFTVQAVDFATGKVFAASKPFVVLASDPTTTNVSVPGMSKYTDPDFSFSFWYPSGWQVTKGKSGSGSFSDSSIRVVAPPFNSLATVDINLTEHAGSANYAYQPISSASSMGGITIEAYQAQPLPDWFSMSWGSPLKSLDISGRGNILPLLRTVVATDPSVATPVSVAEQTKTIQAEKDAYAGQ